MRYNYSIQYSNGTIEKSAYSLTEQYIYSSMGKAIHEYLRYHKGETVVATKIEAVER